MSAKPRIAATIASALVLFACSSENASRDMVRYVKEVESRAPGKVEPIPESPVYSAVTYNDHEMRSPFSIPVKAKKEGAHPNGPDFERPREPLEQYPLDSLTMVGTLTKEGKTWAIIKDKEGAVHTVTIGNYVGQNFGKVVAVTSDETIILEKIPDDNDTWKDHEAVIKMTSE